MKQKQYKNLKQAGFTIMEVLVVVSIMAVISTVVVIDFNRQRDVRSLVLAKNETVTNLRKVQNYMLSSKNISEGVPAKFYIAKFNNQVPNSFTLQAVDDDFVLHDNLEVINLPAGIEYSSLTLKPKDEFSKPTQYQCLSIIFSAPFGKIYSYGEAAPSQQPGGRVVDAGGGSKFECGEQKIEDIIADPLQLSEIGQRSAVINLSINGEDKGYIEINPITGQITAN